MEGNKRGSAGGRRIGGWFRYLLRLPAALAAYAAGRRSSAQASREMRHDAAPLSLSPGAVARLKESLKALERAGAGGGGAVKDGAWSHEERVLIERIMTETECRNRNNVTRTEAYRSVYFHSPELHWALLAHLVSRNGGWSMTDLQGEWLPQLLGEERRRDIFAFLERANALIFRDAYPQLLLYQWSRKEGRSLFHLLPAFGVSAFMGPVWRQFWRERDSALLSVALIVNEQHYIEERVVRNPFYKSHVLDTLVFGMQPYAQLNGVVFPYGSDKERGVPLLAGLILERFGDLRERIEFGKRLYALLFGIPRVLAGARAFAAAVEHTGSRSDYAPQLFQQLCPPQLPYEGKLRDGRLKPGAASLYSPTLQTAWGDWPFEPPEPGDWYAGAGSVAHHLDSLPLPEQFEMTNEYGAIMSKLELAVLALPRSAGKPFP